MSVDSTSISGPSSPVNPRKGASDRKEGKGTVLDAFLVVAANPHFLCWYHYPHTSEEEIQQS